MEKVGIFVAILVGIVVTTTSANHAITAPSFRSALRLFNNPIESRVGLSKATTPNRKNMHFVTEEEGNFAHTNKRQTTCALTNEVRDQRLAEVQCDADYMNALQELEGIECSFVATIRQFTFFITQRSFPECGTDRNGVLCGVHETAQTDPDDEARDIIQECFENVENCTDECKTLLEAFVSRFDCCVHSLSVTSSEQLIRALTPQLWDDCGVILPAPCDNAPPELPPIDLNISCSYECTINQAQALFCKYQAQEAISIYLECGDDESALRIQQPCGFNDRGEFCFPVGRSSFPLNILGFFASVIIRDDLNDEYFLELYSKCISFVSTGKCPSECRDALANAKETYGCCFNNANGTALGLSSSEADPVDSIRSFVTSYDLWSGCVIETPGFCNFPSDDSVFDEFLRCSPDTCDPQSTSGTFPPGVVAAIALPVILLMIAVPAMVYCCYCKR